MDALTLFGIALVLAAFTPLPRTTRRGGLLFFRIGRFGGSFYIARAARREV